LLLADSGFIINTIVRNGIAWWKGNYHFTFPWKRRQYKPNISCWNSLYNLWLDMKAIYDDEQAMRGKNSGPRY